ncbi:DUF1016 N-terminal domain-containing protein [Promicromonospora sp. MS192]|uniref:DUF1016 N-terminal domain-containing protein n=1 Tax=Promicromonospora sp. MS192 TaxID=3412684 RepID=UPI003C2AD855
MTISTTTDSREPDGYDAFITDLKHRVRSTQFRMVRAANTELLRLFWNVGNEILTRQRDQGWGAKVVDRISADLRREFPGQRSWSRRNLLYMRKVAEVWPTESEFVHQPGAQLPWRHVTVLLDKLRTRTEREWYAARAVENAWSRASLEFEIMTPSRAPPHRSPWRCMRV